MPHVTDIPGLKHLPGSLRFPKGGWLVRYRDENRKSQRQTFATRKEAEAFREDVRTDKRRGVFWDEKRARTPFNEVAEDWFKLTVNLRPKTRAGYRQILDTHLLPELGRRPIGGINRAAVKRLLAKLAEQKRSPGTQRNVFRVLSPIMAHAVDDQMIRVNPCVGIKIEGTRHKPEMKFLTASQVRQLADEIGDQYRTLVLTAAYTGMRAGELAALQIKNVDLLHSRISVTRSVADISGELHYGPPKNGKVRTFGIPRFLAELLTEQIAGKTPDDLVFTGPQGAPLRHGTYYGKHFRPAVRQLVKSGEWPESLSALRFHDLRHTAAALLIKQGTHPKAISDRLGHSGIAITMDLYGHLYEGHDAELMEGLEATFREAGKDDKVVRLPNVADNG